MKEYQIKILSNIALCYMSLHLFEDALIYCNKALTIDSTKFTTL